MIKKLSLLAFLSIGGLFAQQGNVTVQPDCSQNFTFTAVGSSQGFANSSLGCVFWIFTYQSTGFSGLTLTMQGAPDSAGAPGSWATLPGTVSAGANPQNSTTGGYTSVLVSPTNAAAWLRMTLSGLTGSGRVTGRMYGWRDSSAGSSSGGGCSSPCVVIGPTTTGSPQVNPAVFVAGIDSAGNTVPLTSCTSTAIVNISSSGNNQVIAAVSSKSIRVCNVDLSFPSPASFAFHLTQGTGLNCVSGTADVNGITTVNSAVLGSNDDPGNFSPYVLLASNALCINLSTGVTVQGTIHYAVPF